MPREDRHNFRKRPEYIKWSQEDAKRTYITIPPSSVSFSCETFANPIIYKRMIAIQGVLKGLKIHLESLTGNLKQISVRATLVRAGVSTFTDLPMKQGDNEYPDLILEVQPGDRLSVALIHDDETHLKDIDARAGGLWGAFKLYPDRSEVDIKEVVKNG